MSATSSRPIITTLLGAAIFASARTVGTVLNAAGEAARGISHETARLAQRALDERSFEIPSLPIARDQADTLEEHIFRQITAASPTNVLSARKEAAIAAIVQSPFVAADPTTLMSAVARLESASTLAAVERARKDLRKTVERGHAETWMAGLRDACTRAFEKTDFRPLDVVSRSPFDIVVSAVNRDGKVMVSELSMDRQGAPRLQTEVVNGCGPECEGLLESFDKALEEEIRGSAPVRRKTGGMCQLDAAKAFVARKVRRPGVQKEEGTTQRRRDTTTATHAKRS